MTKFVHIVYVHPVELGEPNLSKVKEEQEFTNMIAAQDWIINYNAVYEKTRAVYYGCVNDETGELV